MANTDFDPDAYLSAPQVPAAPKATDAAFDPDKYLAAAPERQQPPKSEFGPPAALKPKEVQPSPIYGAFERAVDAADPLAFGLPSIVKKGVEGSVGFAQRAYEEYKAAPAAEKAKPPTAETPNQIWQGLQAGVPQAKQMYGRFAEGMGHLLGWEGAAESGKNWADESKAAQEELPARVPSARNIRGDTWGHFFQDAASFMGYQAGQGVISTLPSLAFSGVATFATRNPRIGTAVGTAVGSYPQNYGDVYGGLKEDKDIYARVQNGELSEKQLAASAIAPAVVMTALDMWGMDNVLGKELAKTAKQDLAKRIVKGFASGALVEGTTEGLQEVVKQWFEQWMGGQKGAYEQFWSVVDNFLGGAATGAPTKAVTSAFPGRQDTKAPAPALPQTQEADELRSILGVPPVERGPGEPPPPPGAAPVEDQRSVLGEDRPDESRPDPEYYVGEAMRNLRATSRTAKGILDTSSTPGKEDQMTGVSAKHAATLAQENFEGVIRGIYDRLDEMPQDGQSMAAFIDGTAEAVNEGIVKPGKILRENDTKIPAQTAAADLPAAHAQFSEEMAARLADPNADPVETAAWIEWRSNMIDHFWTDGVGKCLGRGTGILMYDGTIKPVEQVVNGDLLMGPDSRPRVVSGVCSGTGPLFRVTPTKGESYVVNIDHVLSLKKSTHSSKLSHHKLVNVPVSEYMNWSPCLKRTTLSWRSGVEWTEKNLPLPPYLLGAWLGDGTSTQAAITTMDMEVSDSFLVYAQDNGLQCKVGAISGRSSTFVIARTLEEGVNRWIVNPFRRALRALGLLDNKHIPHVYKTASRQQRLELLAGLIDTDGHLIHNCFEIVQKRREIADDIVFIARSLGLAAYVKSCQKTCTNVPVPQAREYFRVHISGNTDEVPTKILRKKASARKQRKDARLTGIQVEPTGDGEFFGFAVDCDHLFLLGDFTVTHNSSKALAAIPLMRAGLPLPNYPSSREYFSYSPKERVDPSGGGEAYLGPAWERFNAFYHTLVDKPEPQQRAELKAMLESADTPLNDIITHPAVRRARDINAAAVATGSAENFADPAWRQARVYDFGGERVQGWDQAVERLTDQARAFSTAEPVEQGNHAVIVLGPPAAGKSTVSEPLARSLRAAIVDADEAKKVIPEYRNGLGSHASHEESSELAKGVFKNLLRDGSNVILPKVGHSYESIKGLVDVLKSLGYRVDIAHVAATTEISHRRNIARFLETGRLVDPNHITEVGDKPRNTAYMLKGEANDFIDADTSKGFEIVDGSGPLADALRARRNVGWSPDTGRAGTPEGTRRGAQPDLIGEPVFGMQAHRVTDADGRTIDVAPIVVEAGSLRTSRDYGYDQDLQPRDRDRAASDAQIREIENKLDPERLGYSSEADRGSPIVGSDGMVESGNGRVIALRNVYDKGGPQAQAYRDWLSRQGVNVDAYQHPVLVRQRLTPLTPKERQGFTLAANRPATLAMSAPERAVSDARHMDARMLGLIKNPDDIGSVANRAFSRRFLSMLPKSEHGTLADAKGHLSAEGLTRVRNAILAKAYGNTGVLARIAESTNDEVKSISNALTAAAPAWAAMRADVEAGRVRADIDITPDLVRAVERTAEIRSRGESLDAFLAQQDAFDRTPAEVEGFMRMFYDPKGRRAAAAKRITDALRFYADEASKVSTERGLGLDLVPVAPQDIQRLALQREWQDVEQHGVPEPGRSPGDGAGNAARGRETRGPWLGEGREVAAQRLDAGDPVEEAIRAQRPTLDELRFGTRRVTEKTKAGDQFVFPGGERISSAELARRRAAEPMRPRAEQRPTDFGLFGETAPQGDLLAPPPPLNPATVAPTVAGNEEIGDGRPGIQPAAPTIPGRTQARRLAKTPASRPPELPLFGWEPSGGPVRQPDEAVRPESGGQEPPVHGEGPSVTKPPARGGRNRPGRTDLPAVKGRLEAEKKIAERSRSNYRITPEDQVGVGNARQKIKGNIEAIRTLKAIQDENRFATPAEKAILVKYVGWGAYAQDMFAAHKPEWKNERDAFRALVSDDEYNAAKASTLNAHFTSPEVISGMWDAMDHLGFKGGQAIEPAAGTGHFIGLIPDKFAPKTAWTAIELDPLTGGIAKALYGGTDVGIHGFEDLKRPSNYYDLAVSNVPFGDYHISEKPYGSFPVHDFFFVKSLDKVRPGGVVAFITSRYTMDRVDPETRRLLGQTADLVGAIRLPGGRKGAFAGNAGTEVTTDIIFLRKKVPGEPAFPGAKWTDLKEIQTPEGPVNINEYFANRPDMMLGEMRLQGSMYRANEPVLVGEAEGIQQRIAEAARKMPEGALLPMDSPPPLPISGDEIGAGIKDGSFFLQAGRLYQRRQGQGFEHPLNQEDHDRVARLVDMRGIINDLLQTQLDAGAKADADRLRGDLRSAYDAFAAKYGPINKEVRTVTDRLDKEGEPIIIVRTPNFTPFRKDPDAWKVASIEDYDSETGKSKRAAIQTKDVIDAPKERQINGPSDALSASLNDTAGVDLDHIAQSLNLDSHDAVVEALGDQVYQNPDGRKWETADEYLSGNVVKKLGDARALAQQDPSYLKNVAALEKVQPEPLTGTDITAQFGAPWIPESVYQDFLSEIGIRNPKVVRVPITGEWRFDYGNASQDAQVKYGTDRVEVGKIVNAALNNKMVTVYDRGADDKAVVNDKATQEARVKTELLKEAFTGDMEHGIDGWVFAEPDRAQLLEGIYNRTYNNLAQRQFDGSHLTLPGLNPDFATRKHRRDAIWRIVQSGNTLLAHSVGAGKTVTMVTAGMEEKRLGLINKPMMVVPNHMLEQFSREFIQAYPNAKILVAQKNEMTRENRKEFLAKVAANDWDSVIITHDAFGRINMGQEFRKSFIQDQLDELERVMQGEAAAGSKKSQTVKNLEKAKKKLQERLQNLLNEERKDEGTSFEESGIDRLYVDEAHKFKNLQFITRMQNIAGLAQGNSQRAEDLFLKVRYLEQKRPGRSAVFATGTPVSNTMAELWTMMRYLELDKLRERGLDTFDAWASTFGRVVNNMELSADGRTFKERSSFSKFVNIPELIALYSEVADTKTADMLNLPRPEVKTRSGAPGIEIVEATPSAQEEEHIEALVKLAESLKGKRPKKGQPNMLSVVTAGRKVATDGRLIGPDFDFNPRGKIALAVGNIARIYEEGNKDPAAPNKVQMVFLDMGVPQSRSAKATLEVTKRSDGLWDLKDKKTNQWLGGAFATRADAEKYISSQTDRIDLYADLKQRLVDKGIPAREIAAIHDAGDDIKKAKLFQRVRSGDVRVILGSSEKMGVGTNVQDLLIAMHHLDAPWKPAEVEQRDGRIVRQGNKNKNVQIYRYVTKKSFDAFMWQKLDTKARFIGQVLSGAKGSRHAEDIDNPLPEAAEMKAAASGDPRILEHAELDRVVRALSAQRRAFDSTKSRANSGAGQAKSRIEMYEKALPNAKEDAAAVQDIAGDRFAVELGDAGTVTNRAEAGKAILGRLGSLDARTFYTPKVFVIGRMSGFTMNMELRGGWDGTQAVLRATPSLKGKSGYGAANDTVINEYTDPAGLIRRYENILANIKFNPERLTRELANEKESLGKLQKTLSGEWPREKEYREALKKLDDLSKAMKAPEHPDVTEAQSAEVKAQVPAEENEFLTVKGNPVWAVVVDPIDNAILHGIRYKHAADNDFRHSDYMPERFARMVSDGDVILAWADDRGVHAMEPLSPQMREAVERLYVGNGVQQRIGDGVYVDGNKAVVDGAPRADYVRAISDGDAPLPSAKELSSAIAATRDADRRYSNAIGISDADYNKLRRLNREIDQGGTPADDAIKEKDAILAKANGGHELDISDEGELRQLATEFGSLERSGGETQAEHIDGMARVLKRYIAGFTDGDPFARAVFRKAFDEAKAAGYDTKKLGNDVINRFMGDLSKSDQDFMRKEFVQLLAPKLADRARTPTLGDTQRVITAVANSERLKSGVKEALVFAVNSLIAHSSQMHGSYLDGHISEAVSRTVHQFRDVAGVSAFQMRSLLSKVASVLAKDASRPRGWETAEGRDFSQQPGERAIRIGRSTEAHVKPAGRYTKAEQKIAAAVQEIGTRMAPQANVRGVAALRMHGDQIWGAFVNSEAFPHLIAWSLEKGGINQIAGTVRHEIVHHLREAALIRPAEWAALRDAAIEGDWLGKHNIEDRYPGLSRDAKIEEAVAEQFANWRTDRAVIKTFKDPVQRLIRDAFNRIDLLLRRIAAAARKFLGRDATASDVFTRMETGEVGRREMVGSGRQQKATIDSSHIPKLSPKLKDRDGNPANLWKYLAVHETEERQAMAKGVPYETAHAKWATPAERTAVEADGVDWKAYTHEIDGYLAAIEHERVKNPPPNPHVDPSAAVNGQPHHHSENKAQAPGGSRQAYIDRLRATIDLHARTFDEKAFDDVWTELQADKSIRLADAEAISRAFTGRAVPFKTRKAALDAIRETHIERARFINKLKAVETPPGGALKSVRRDDDIKAQAPGRRPLSEIGASDFRQRIAEIDRPSEATAPVQEPVEKAFPVARTPEELARLIAEMRPRSNQWISVPEGEIYIRIGERPEIGTTLEIPNIEFREGARGTGAFTKYLSAMERAAAARNLDSVYVEQLFNKRLEAFLRRHGYRDEPRGRGILDAVGRSDQAALYKRVDEGNMFVAAEPYRLNTGAKPRGGAEENAANALDSAGNHHGRALREISQHLDMLHRHGLKPEDEKKWNEAAAVLRKWKKDGVELVGEHKTESERDYAASLRDDDVKAQTPGREARERRQAAGVPARTILQRVVQSSDRFRAKADAYADSIGVNEIIRGLQMSIAPMAARDATVESRLIPKEFANERRQSRQDWNNADKFIMDHFPADRRKAMWEAADEQSVAMQQGLPTVGIGLDRLPPNERGVVQMLQDIGRRLFDEARSLRMVQAAGLPSYAPRMLVRMTNDKAEVGAGAGSEIVRDIRTLALANARLQDAIAARKMINKIEDIGRRSGTPTVNGGGAPTNRIGAEGVVVHAIDQMGQGFSTTTPQLKHRKHLTAAGTEAAANLVRTPNPNAPKWFTINNPAFMKLGPRLRVNQTTGKAEVVKDKGGNPIFDRKPIYVRSDFEGPLRSVLESGFDTNKLYQALMALKGKAMSVIMMSPLIHNQVEWGRALPAAPAKVLTFQIYLEGNRVAHDPVQMREAIAGGTAPIGGHGFMQDLTSIAEAPTVRPGSSVTAKGLGYAAEATGHITRLFNPRTGADGVRSAVDYFGKFWHNTLLWDRIRDLQMGLWANTKEYLLGKGYNPYAANVAASHFANRYAGALPIEAMSGNARGIANLLLFSRTFTLGNLGAFKDAAIGLPRDAQAMIQHHAGWDELQKIQSFVKRKSRAMLAFDAGLYYVTLSALQSAFNTAGVVPSVATLGGMIAGGALGGRGGKYGRIAAAVGGGAAAFGLAAVLGASPGTKKLEDELKGYWERFAELLRRVWEHPFEVVAHPIDLLESLSSTAENEPGKKGRILIGYEPDGTAIYARLAVGKVTEEFIGWGSSPLEMLHNKLSTFARPMSQIWSNDAGFGHKIYNPKAHTYGEQAKNVMKIAATIVGSQIPIDTIKGAKEWAEGGPGSDVAGLKAISPFIGTTVSKGYPGGPELGVLNDAREHQRFEQNEWMPTIRKQIRNGEIEKAKEKMIELGIAPGLQKYYITTTQNPKARLTKRQMQDFMRYATPEQKREFEAAQQQGASETRSTGGAVAARANGGRADGGESYAEWRERIGWANGGRVLARANGGRVDASNIDPSPSPAQAAAGNYRHDHVRVQGLDISIENAKGSTRKGVGPDGKPWSATLCMAYGYIKRTTGADSDHLDVYLGPHVKSPRVYVIDQINPDTGKWDEHKAVIGLGSEKQAREFYARCFSDGKGHARIGRIHEMAMERFKSWLNGGDTAKPFFHVIPESEKCEHTSVGYVPKATVKGAHCSVCTHYIPGVPPACEGVKKPIAPVGWCRRYRKA